MASTSEVDNKEIDIKGCECDNVTVYLDRAEVTRSTRVKVPAGENEVAFKNLSQNIDTDSVRVEGKGKATISEVCFTTRYPTEEDAEQNKEKSGQVRKQIVEAEDELKQVNNQRARLQKKKEVLDEYAANIVPKATVPGAKEPINLFADDTHTGLKNFFDLYFEQGENVDQSILDMDKKIKSLNEKLNNLRRSLNDLAPHRRSRDMRYLSVILEVEEDSEVTLIISYVVLNASWSPKYDIRVFSKDSLMKIMYFGMVKQNTGEDWNDCKLGLSTATPSVGGTVPELGTQKLEFKRPEYMPNSARSKTSKLKGLFGRQKMMMVPQAAMAECYMQADMMCDEEESDEEVAMEVAEAEVRESITSTTYDIARRSTIPSDNTEHKVTVAILDFHPEFMYESVPRINTNAFLKAKIKNTSNYALLAGPSNIYLDNNFISKATIKAVSPAEEFNCSLGVDPSIRITFKPQKKIKGETGLINKWTSTAFEQTIEIKNTKQEPVRLLVTDHLPLSTDDKLKVHLTEPDVKKGEAKLNNNNNLEWDFKMAAGGTRNLAIKYKVDHPPHEEFEFNTQPAV